MTPLAPRSPRRGLDAQAPRPLHCPTMAGPGADESMHVVVNGRMLAGPSSFVRLQAEHLVRLLIAGPSLRVTLVVPAGIGLAPDLDSRRHDLPLSTSTLGEAAFDQLAFPRAAGRLGAEVVVFPHAAAPFASRAPAVAVWDLADMPGGDRRRSRFLDSLSLSALAGAAAVLRPSDVPLAPAHRAQVRLPPTIPEGFNAARQDDDVATRAQFGLPESYVLTVCSEPRTVPLLLAAWTWVEGSMGDSHALVFAETDSQTARQVDEASRRMGLTDTVGAISMDDRFWPAILRGAAALVHGGEPGNSAALRWALAAGVVVAGVRTRLSESILGPAAYLVDAGDGRALGAACLTLLVEEQVAEGLRRTGLERAAAYHAPATAAAWRAEIWRAAGRKG